MINLIKATLIICIFISCQARSGESNKSTDDLKLVVKYSGEADVVQFKMFIGLHQILSKDSIHKIFTGSIEIPNLKNAIFSYDIIVHRKDTLGKMIELEPQSDMVKLNNKNAIAGRNRFLWIGQNRKGDYLENIELEGFVTSKFMTNEMLNEEREITIYTPNIVTKDIPHIYFTDGSVIKYYAPFIDRLISTNRIEPVKLIGIHSSSSNRYEEYVQGGEDNDVFIRHETFIYNQVLKSIEKDIENWNGKRYFFGFSNGAAFCMHAGLNHPDLFDEIIAFSTADYISPIAQMMNSIEFKYDKYPKFYMGAGIYETSIYNDNLKFVEQMNNNNLEVQFKEFISGHDSHVWRIEFLEYLEKRFAK